MTWPVPFDRARLDLFVRGRISEEDAHRQAATAEAIVERLAYLPGLVLADEVGMGKTFVALSVAVSALWDDRGRRPVVVMTPASVQEKWSKDFEVFRDLCIRDAAHRNFRHAQARDAVAFFRLLDDPPSRRARIIFLTHGAFHRTLQDPWVKLAILKFGMHHAKLGARRESIIRHAASILRVKGTYSDPELFRKLLASDFARWRDIIASHGEDPQDDPVPDALVRALHREEYDFSTLREHLLCVPLRSSANLERRLADVRRALNAAFQEVWRLALVAARFRSPLLILDEAHHVKNPGTQLASLFVDAEAAEDARLLAGALKGGFERMLFLTATPFQLGHGELLNVISRFRGIDWRSMPKTATEEQFLAEQTALAAALDEAQRAATELDWNWGKLRASDLRDGAETERALEAWWDDARRRPAEYPERVQQVVRAFERARTALHRAGEQLRPWVVRHLRPRTLGPSLPRRLRFPGNGIHTTRTEESLGLPISDGALLPFLLAARAQAIVGRLARAQRDRRVYRATFAEGLASSYETFLETRAQRADAADETAGPAELPRDPRLEHYLERLRGALPSESAFAEHPKIAAVVQRVCDLWERGEKTVVFCHYRVTGRALVKHLSQALDARLWALANHRLQVPVADLRELARLWHDGFEEGRPLERALREVMDTILSQAPTATDTERRTVIDIVCRFMRTESFLGRFVDLTAENRADALRAALNDNGAHEDSLRARLETFVAFLFGRLTSDERSEYFDALTRIHPGPRFEAPTAHEHGGAMLVPNVRLANGAIDRDVRRRLLLGFNTPFLPEVLVASSVMAEGVDLHLNCRHMIHHDLDWNPSVLEQRTGRVDRIGAKAERVRRSIEVFLPYLGGTQDEKMYRVVMDRERWFQIVMGEDFRTDEHSTEEAAQRVPLPESVAKELTLRLEVHGRATV